jgi:hypothetical protein
VLLLLLLDKTNPARGWFFSGRIIP